MRLFFRFTAMMAGTAALIFGFSSCNKDKNSNECCGWTYSDDDETYSYTIKACEDGSVLVTYTYDGDSYTENYDWHDDYDTWAEVKDVILEEYGGYGARCY